MVLGLPMAAVGLISLAVMVAELLSSDYRHIAKKST
jgi:uncharacterized membrane protein YqjE